VADVLIIGGGVIGCATAYYLAEQGAGVTIIERGEVGGEASGAAAGMLAALSDEGDRPTLFTRLCEDSLRLYEPLLPVLADTGIDVRHYRVGVLNLALTQTEAQILRERFGKQRKRLPGLQWLEPEDLRRVEPESNPKSPGGLLLPDQQYVDPLRTTEAMAEAARRLGVTILEGETVSRFVVQSNGVLGARTASGTYEADHVLIAGGPWTGELTQRLGVPLETPPVRGQMLSLEGPPQPLHNMIWGEHAYLVPREDGQTYVGATVENVGFRKHTTTSGLGTLRRGAAGLVPALRDAKQRRAWAGLRPGSADGMPIMGRLPGWSNVWVSTGHLRNGILLAPVAGQMMARSILSDEPVPEMTPLSPRRFFE
jgi:glycine oxidase